MNKCIGLLPDKTLCDNQAIRNGKGYCAVCDPNERKKRARLQAEEEARKEQARAIQSQELDAMIEECSTIDDLRKLELKILSQVARGLIDPRAGSSIVQICKHQEQLIDRKENEGKDLNDGDRERAIALAKEMSPEKMLGFIGDIAHGLKFLMKEAKSAPLALTVEAEEVKDVT